MSKQIVAEYILVASGSVVNPQLNIVVEGDATRAINTSKNMVAALSKGGYFHFYLYEVIADHLLIATFQVETPEPVVNVTVKGA